MVVHGYRVTYTVRWPGAKSAYQYQRFFRALYGYKQVVSKGSGRHYVYFRPGVLSRYPYIKEAKTTVVIPDNALQPLLSFLKTGQNPAHRFNFTSNWSDIVKYSMEETTVDNAVAADAILSALDRVRLDLVGGVRAATDLLQNVDSLTPDEIYSLYYAIQPVIQSNWFRTLSTAAPGVYSSVSRLLSLI